MKQPEIPKNEDKRLMELESLEILDTEAEEIFDHFTELASHLLKTPVSIISLVDKDRQWFKSIVGLDAKETPREYAFCAHAIHKNDLFIVEDATKDKRFADNPLVKGEPLVISYAGYPLKLNTGLTVGTLCSIDHKPRKFSEEEQKTLKLLGSQLVNVLNQRKTLIKFNKFSRMLEEIHRISINHSKEYLKIDYQAFLKTGLKVLNLDFGIISKIDQQTYTVVDAISPDNMIASGAEFELPGTYCVAVKEKKKTITYNEVGKIDEMHGHPVYINMKLESYIGTPVWVNGEIYGTVNFSSQSIRKLEFSKEEERFIEILAQVLGKMIEGVEREKQIIQAAKAKDNFLANMSHEIRTPLNSIIGIIEILKENKTPSEQEKYLSILNNSSEHLSHLIEDILDISRIEAENFELKKEVIDFKNIFSKINSIFHNMAEENYLTLNIIDNLKDQYFVSDETRLMQILVNLIGNAIKFTEVGSVTLEVTSNQTDKSGNVYFSVRDTGPGISDQNIKSIFQKFTQLEEATSKTYSGTGLGLAIVQRIVEKMGGEIWLESEVGKGSNFQFTAQMDVEKPQKDEQKATSLLFDFSDKENINVLVADDNKVNRMILTNYLSNLKIHVEEAVDGGEVIERNSFGDIDIILLDMQMPNIDGYEAIRNIRESEKQSKKKVYIVAVSAFAMKEQIDKAIEIGCDSYITKPIKKNEILKLLKELFNIS